MQKALIKAQFGISPPNIGIDSGDITQIINAIGASNPTAGIPIATYLNYLRGGTDLMGNSPSSQPEQTSTTTPTDPLKQLADINSAINIIASVASGGDYAQGQQQLAQLGLSPDTIQSLVTQVSQGVDPMQIAASVVDPNYVAPTSADASNTSGSSDIDSLLSALGAGTNTGQVTQQDELSALMSLLPALMDASGTPATPSTSSSSSQSYNGGTRMQDHLPVELLAKPQMAPTWNPASSPEDFAAKAAAGNILGHSVPAIQANQQAQNDYLSNLVNFFAGTMEQLPSSSSETSVSNGGLPAQPGDPMSAFSNAQDILDMLLGRPTASQEMAEQKYSNAATNAFDLLKNILGYLRTPNDPNYAGPSQPQAFTPQFASSPSYGIPAPGAQFPGLTGGLPFGQ